MLIFLQRPPLAGGLFLCYDISTITRLMNKVCKKCGIEKPLSEYHFEKGRNKYRAQCKDCRNATRRKYYPQVKDKINAKVRDRWANEPGYAEKQRSTSLKSYYKNHDKNKERIREKYANDPEFAEKQRQYQRTRWANMSDDEKKEYKLKTDQWIVNNKKKYQEYKKQYGIDNKDWIAERSKKYREENPQHVKKLRRSQYEKHQDKLVTYQQEFRKNRRHHLIERLGGKCVECGTTKRLQFDHIDPLKKSFDISHRFTANLDILYPEIDKCQLLCPKCHIEKTKQEWLNGTLQLKRGF